MTSFAESFRSRVNDLLVDAKLVGLTEHELCRRAGVSPQTLSRYVATQPRTVSIIDSIERVIAAEKAAKAEDVDSWIARLGVAEPAA